MSIRAAILAGSLSLLFVAPVRGENWPQWRGPNHNGVSGETGLPVAWSQTLGIRWKCKLPEWGTSTPAIWGDAIFLTSHAENSKLLLLRIDKATGQIVWTRQVGGGSVDSPKALRKTPEMRRHQQFHATHNLATPSPVTDGEVVVVHFGSGDLAAFDFDGRQLWHRNLQEENGDYTIWWGHANSPVLYKNLVISVCIQDSCSDLPGDPAPSYMIAHFKETGVESWKSMRPTEARAEHCDAYTTPVFWRNGDAIEMIVMGGQILNGYDPASGKELWSLPGLTGNRVITGPVVAHDHVYTTQGMRQPLLAVELGGRGELDRKDVAWHHDTSTPDSPTPVVWGDLLFMVSDNGIAKCLDAHTGHLKWTERLEGAYRASPLAAEGRIYFLNMEGLATVVAATPRFGRITKNQLDDDTIASPIVSDGNLFIRGRKWLYCIKQ
ncbi:MAG: PQQ-binding-like beta-propeller repeat protein [Planctomycetes bacterium]|nr:PQQ-binding-like beta-propeller repeat protein [Planctomycetota bacterium]